MNQLTEKSQRFYIPGWAWFLQGKQEDLDDRYLMDLDGTMTRDPKKAFVIDGHQNPELYDELQENYYRQFYSTHMRMWV